MIRRFLSTSIAFLGSIIAAFGAVNGITPGEVQLLSTFECISVKSKYTGDDNSNATATIQFRATGNTTWLDAYTPVIDRRSNVVVLTTTNDNANWLRQARGSIVGLTPNTSYDVKVTWSDSDGITGNASSTNTVSTLSYAVPTNGTIRYVDGSAGSEGSGTSGSPWKTITNAIAQSSAGDTILVSSNVYVSMSIGKAGTASAYFVLKTTDGAIIDGGAITHSLNLNSNYWVIDGFSFAQSQQSGLIIAPGVHHVYVQNTVQTNGVSQTNNYTGTAFISDNTYDIYFLTNVWKTANPGITNSTDGFVNNVDIEALNGSNYVISANTLIGGWDCIGNRVNSAVVGTCENSDFCHNRMTNWIDDLVELDGLGPNVRFFDNLAVHHQNTYDGNYGGSLLSDVGTYLDPNYVFRNRVQGVYTNDAGTAFGGGLGLKMGGHSSWGRVFYLHNTFVTSSTSGSHETISVGDATNKVFLNNIFSAIGNVIYAGNDRNVHDYNTGFKGGSAYWAGSWNLTTDYPLFSDFQAGTGQEAHGLGSDPLLNSDLTIPTNSPVVNAGVVLANFNDANSAWPYTGAAPDAGAYEIPAVIPPPSTNFGNRIKGILLHR